MMMQATSLQRAIPRFELAQPTCDVIAIAPNPTEAWRGTQTEHIIIALYPLVRKQNGLMPGALAACKTLGIQR